MERGFQIYRDMGPAGRNRRVYAAMITALGRVGRREEVGRAA